MKCIYTRLYDTDEIHMHGIILEVVDREKMKGLKSPTVAEKALLGSPIDLEGASEVKSLVAGGLTKREMDSLTAISDTFIPSINLTTSSNEEVTTFYETSASMLDIPQIVGEFMATKLCHPLVKLLRIALWFLSTWYGTLVLSRAMNLSTNFPYVHKFSDLDAKRREEIMLWWTNNPINLLRWLFRSLKSLVFLFYYTQVNEKKENPTWKAIDYCGPDPDHTTKLKSTTTNKGALHKALVYIESSKDTLSTTLSKIGISLNTCRHPKVKNEKQILRIQCDAVIVGSGSGGGVVAGVLAKAGYKVVVLEKGNYYSGNNLSLLEGQSMDQMYEKNGALMTNDTGVAILSGSTVGGGSTINWSASLRTPDHVISEWRNEYGIELFGSDAYYHALDMVCDRMGVQEEVGEENLNNSVLRHGCKELGYPVKNIPRNSGPDHYCGWCCFGCKDGEKKGTRETWLVDMHESGNGVILPGCKATEVLSVDKGRKRNVANGVMFEYQSGFAGEKETCMIESKVTVIACGALNTPVLLKNSGLKNPNIGKNLHLHPVVMAWGYFPEEKIKKSYEGGIMTSMSTVEYNSDSTGYGAIIQTPQLHPGMYSVVTPWTSGKDSKDRMMKFAKTAHMIAIARDKGTGSIDSAGFIQYKLDGTDEDNLRKGLEKMLRIAAAAGAVEIGTQNFKGDRLNVKSASSHEFEDFVKMASGRGLRDFSNMICSAHQMGSCRMGVNPENSVVKPNGESWEIEGLYLADTSVFPTALGVNPMVTVQAIAYCTAQSIIEDLRRKIRKGTGMK